MEPLSSRRVLLLAPAILSAGLLAPQAAGAASCAPARSTGGEWRSYGADLSNTRHQTREKLISPADVPLLTPAWTFSTVKGGGAGDITGTPVVADGCLYVGTNRGWVFALDADTSAVVWKALVPYGGGVNASVGLGRIPAEPAEPCPARRKARRGQPKRKGRRGRARAAAAPGAKRRRAKRRKARARCPEPRAKRRRAKRGAHRKARRRFRGPRPAGTEALYAAVSRTRPAQGCPAGDPCTGPYVVALERDSGKLLWATPPIDTQNGADVYGSPIVFEGTLLIGVSGGAAELGDEADRYAFQGSMSFLDAGSGKVLRKTWTIHPPNQPNDDFAGAGVWSTPGIDTRRKVAYAGAGNPFRPRAEHKYANAVLKYDVDRRSPTFGQILGSYKGELDEYVPGFSQLPCYDFPGNNPPYYPQGIGSCGDIDMDFGASPNLFTGPDGRKLVGAGQKSGVYHVFDAETMQPVWKQIVGPPTSVGGIVGSTAHDGQAVYGPITVPGYVWSISASDGSHRWFGPIGDGVHWGPPVAVANGVVYSVDTAGYLDAWDARRGVPLLRRPLALGGSGPVSLSWGAVSVARNKVYAGVGLSSLSEGFVVAFRKGGAGDVGGDVGETLGGGGAGGGGGGGGGPALGTAIVAAPGATYTGYATPFMTTQVGGPLSFVNLDAVPHDVTSDAHGPDGRPLFASRLSGLGEIAPVEGLDRVKSGQSYGFYCSVHPGMRGTLAVR